MLPFPRVIAAVAFLAAAFTATTHAIAQTADDPDNTMVITLESGDVVVRLRPDLAPQHVERIKTLARNGEYDNVAFHRVIPGFMAQTGDVQFGDMESGFEPNRAGMGGSDLPDLPSEFTGEPFVRGVVGMARARDPNSANSQFFIVTNDAEFLNGQYTVVGVVDEGMEHVDEIKKGSEANNGSVESPDRMIKVVIGGETQ